MKKREISSIDIREAKKAGRKVAMLTAYDHPIASILDKAGIDIVLVGDSLGNVALGYRNTLPVTMDEMVVHVGAVARGVRRALVVADMPFGSYQENDDKAVANAIRLVKAGAEAVKIEGTAYLSAIRKIIRAGIPVMGHVGFTPQSVNELGCRVQGKSKAEEDRLVRGAKELEKAGCFAVVVELVPEGAGKKIARSVKVPVIGIGAGKGVDGQVVVTNDLIGLYDDPPGFVKPKLNLKESISRAVGDYIVDTRG